LLRKSSWWVMIAVALLAVFVLGYIRAHRRPADSDIADGQKVGAMRIRSSSFSDGDHIPVQFTYDGDGRSPDIKLPVVPAGTKSFALVMDDPDAGGFVHWLVYNIPPGTSDIPEGAAAAGKLPQGAAEGMNSLDKVGYFGPCPPGSRPHHYIFRLYALDVNPGLPTGQTKEQVAATVKGHVLAEGRMTGLYTRGGG